LPIARESVSTTARRLERGQNGWGLGEATDLPASFEFAA
jgi:hypothetical protein